MEFSSGEGGGYLTSPRLATCLGSIGACLVTLSLSGMFGRLGLGTCFRGCLNQEVLCWEGLGRSSPPHDWWSTSVQDQEVADKPLGSPKLTQNY